jgi:magnesium chelatase family protein
MEWYGFAVSGYEGTVVSIEVDIRRGIPGMDIVGLPGSAVREARDRMRVAVRNSGLEFPRDRILVNLALRMFQR